MKKADMEIVYCCECSPFVKFIPPQAAEQAKRHYEIGNHRKTSYVVTEVRLG